jgi:hypothetical protein
MQKIRGKNKISTKKAREKKREGMERKSRIEKRGSQQ